MQPMPKTQKKKYKLKWETVMLHTKSEVCKVVKIQVVAFQ